MPIRHYSWLVSPYSAKTRAYLHYQRVAFDDVRPTVWTLYGRIQQAVGRMIMPTVELTDGTWLQDSSDIIDHFERQPGTTSVTPTAPAVALASSLLEVFGDEWLPMAALHYRWNTPDNARFALDEFADNGLPWLPRVLGRPLIRPMANRMQSYLPLLGIGPQTIPGLERTVETTIAALQATLAERPFVLGGRPSLGDFALYGPLWAHLHRDPGSTMLFDDAPDVVDWMARLGAGAEARGDFEDTVPATLDPIFQAIVDDQLAWNRTLVAAIDRYCTENPGVHRVPRALGKAPFSIGGCTGERKLVTFVQYKAQRPRVAYEVDPAACDAWMARYSGTTGGELVPAIANPLIRVDFKAVLAKRASPRVEPPGR